MKTVRILLSIYSKLSIANFILVFETIINAMTGNANFPAPTPSLMDLNNALNTLKTKAAEVKQGNLTKKPDRDLAKATAFTLISELATYCLYTAQQSSNSIEEVVAKVRSANLVVAQPGENVGPLPAPTNLRGKSLSNACEIEFDSVRGANMYLILKTDGLPSENSVWTETLTTRVKHKFENIQAGQVITCKVYALGPVGKGEASDYCTVMAGM